MRQNKLLYFTLIMFALGSCQKKTIYREFKDLNNYTWLRSEKITFEIPVKEKQPNTNIILSIRHVGEYPYKLLPLKATLTTPSGETSVLEKGIELKDANERFKGDVAGNLYDLDDTLWVDYNFNQTGTYKITLENTLNKRGIPALVDIGLTVRQP